MDNFKFKTNPLSNLYSGGNMLTAHSTPAIIGGQKLDTETLPYGGGTYVPSPNPTNVYEKPVFQGAAAPPPVEPVQATPATLENDLYAKYRDPKTGEIMTPEEYAVYLGDKVPKGNAEIPNYAGDALAKPNATSEELIKMATTLNNSRNDIATGEADPYGVGRTSGIAYSPAELRAIEKAYAGIYDPALNDAFSRLRTKEKEEADKAAREEIVFRTNEAIRQWRETTGTKSTGSGASDRFTKSQLNTGASKAGLGYDTFLGLDEDVQNFFINTPKDTDPVSGKSFPVDVLFDNLIAQVVSGDLDATEAASEMETMPVTEAVKTYYIEQIPDVPEKEKQGILSRVWNWIF